MAVKRVSRGARVPVQERGRQKREQILGAALEVFSRTGLRGTDLSTVARAAGTSAPHVLYYFGSKEALAWELVEKANHELYSLAQHMFTMEAIEGLLQMDEVGRLIEDQPAPARLNAVLLAENLVEGSLNDFFRTRLRDRRGRVAAMIRRSQEAGKIRTDVDPDAEAADLYALLEGLVYHHLLDPERVSIEAGLRRYVDRLLKAIAI